MIQTLFGTVEQEPSLLEKLKSGVQKTRAGPGHRARRRAPGQERDRRRPAGRVGIHPDLRRYRRAHHQRNPGEHTAARGTPPTRRRRRTAQSDSRASAGDPAGQRARPGARGRASGRGARGGRERQRQDHHHRQTGEPLQARAAQRPALRGRHLPRRRHRTIGDLGHAHADPGDPPEAPAATPAPSSSTRCRRPRRARWTT